MSEYTYVCGKCGKEKERFLFAPSMLARKAGGWCRECMKQNQRECKWYVVGKKGWTAEKMVHFMKSSRAADEHSEGLPKQFTERSGGRYGQKG